MPVWLQILFAVVPPGAMGGVLLRVFLRSAENRDKKLETIDGSIMQLVEKVGKQNGRVAVLEVRANAIDGEIKRLRDSDDSAWRRYK